MPVNILLSGVGGQGIITASRIIAEAALISNCYMKKSEVHGMSQRGGSVESHVRLNRDGEVFSSLIPAASADILMAFEALEALRGLNMVRPDGVVIVDDREIVPMSVTAGGLTYPADIMQQLEASGRKIMVIPGYEIAKRLGEQRAANIVMLGAASRFITEIDAPVWPQAIARCVKPKALEININAFNQGLELSGTD